MTSWAPLAPPTPSQPAPGARQAHQADAQVLGQLAHRRLVPPTRLGPGRRRCSPARYLVMTPFRRADNCCEVAEERDELEPASFYLIIRFSCGAVEGRSRKR